MEEDIMEATLMERLTERDFMKNLENYLIKVNSKMVNSMEKEHAHLPTVKYTQENG